MSDALPSPPPDVCWLYLVRHAATANNLERPPRLQGRLVDLELSPQGRDQAARTAALLQDRPIAAIYASPLRRAHETARIIAAPHRVTVELVAELSEADVGDWEGRTWREIERDDPAGYRDFMSDPERHGYAGGENLAQVRSRAIPALERLLAAHVGEAIVAVSHNVVNRTYLAHLLGLDIALGRKVPQDNGGVNLVEYRAGKTKPVSINAIFHLGRG